MYKQLNMKKCQRDFLKIEHAMEIGKRVEQSTAGFSICPDPLLWVDQTHVINVTAAKSDCNSHPKVKETFSIVLI